VFFTVFGTLEFIPHDNGTLFTVIGFIVRIGQAVGFTAAKVGAQLYLMLTFPHIKILMLV
jgi:hypothetical protein